MATCKIDSGEWTSKDAEQKIWPNRFESCPRPGDKVYDLTNRFYMVVSDVEHRNQEVFTKTFQGHNPKLVIVLQGLLMPAT